MNLMLSGLVALQAFTLVGGQVDHWLHSAADHLEARLESEQPAPATASQSIGRAADGMFYLEAHADAAPVRLLVDTGASGTILTRSDAARLGAEPLRDAPRRHVRTLAGAVPIAEAVVSRLEVGGHVFRDVPVGIADDRLGTSLVGQDLLRRFDGVAIAKDRLILR